MRRSVLFLLLASVFPGCVGGGAPAVPDTPAPAVAAATAAATAAAAEKPRLSPSGYVEIWPGTLPVVLSAPHGGEAKPAGIPDRTRGTMTRDGYVRSLAYATREAFRRRYGEPPQLVVCLLSRRKVDCNREIAEGAQGNPAAEAVWREYHAALDEAERAVLARHPHGLYFDLHSHGHAEPRVELGYGLTAADLARPAAELNDPALARRSTVRLLAEASPDTFADLMGGPRSLGALLEQRGIPATPSPKRPLKAGVAYFSGGYDVRTHGSSDGRGLDAVQLETPLSVRRTAEVRDAFGRAVADAASEYLLLHYRMKLGAGAPPP